MAKKHRLAIRQPKDLDHLELTGEVDLGVVAQYGKIIPKKILDFPSKGIINVHTSLLPKYRGAAPIQQALLEGETETGITIMKMDEGLYTGPIILQKSVGVRSHDKHLDLKSKLAKLGGKTLLEAIPKYISGKIEPTKQNEDEATITEKITKDKGKIDWNNTTETIYNKFRAFHNWPGIWTIWNEKRLKLNKITKIKDKNIDSGQVKIINDKIFIGTVDGAIEVKKIQLQGKQAMEPKDFINGYGDRINEDVLDS